MGEEAYLGIPERCAKEGFGRPFNDWKMHRGCLTRMYVRKAPPAACIFETLVLCKVAVNIV